MATRDWPGPGGPLDWRDIASGWEIPREGYCDQPYVVVNDDGSWLCVLTTGPGLEGDSRQHAVATISADRGRTWSALVDIEPHGPPESSWAMPVKTAFGRVYAIYVHNTANVREVCSPFGQVRRVDTLGHYVMKYSDDGGRTWSAERYEIPVREFRIDRENAHGGEVRFFWGVGKPIVHGGAVYFGASKVGDFGEGFLAESEGMILKSENLLTERDPARVRWETLPAGEVGLRAPLGPIAEEQSVVGLSDGSLYCAYRTTEGYLCDAYSRDGGRTWTPPAYATYAPRAGPEASAHGPGQPVPPPGRRIKHPRAAGFVWKCRNGNYLLWFHNHGGRWYYYRNPVWLSGGVERDGPQGRMIHWSEPEVLLYDAEPEARISYPDLIEDGGGYFVTETQKTVARVHEIDPTLLEGMWRQREAGDVAHEALVASLMASGRAGGAATAGRALPSPAAGGGFSLELWLELGRLERGQTILDTRDAAGRGILLETTGSHSSCALRLSLDDGRVQAAWDCDPGLLRVGRRQHVVATVDGGPKLITFVLDGTLCDGGMSRQYGWGRFPAALADVSGASEWRIGTLLHGGIHALRVYGRPLRTSEAVRSWRAGLSG